MPKTKKNVALEKRGLTTLDKLAVTVYDIGRGNSQFAWNTLEEKLEDAEELLFSISEYADLCTSQLNKMRKRASAIGRYLKRKGSRGCDGEFSWPTDIKKFANEMRLSLSGRVAEVAILEDLSARFLSCLIDEEILRGLAYLERKLQQRSRRARRK